MAGISQELKDELIKDLPTFVENTKKFYAKEIMVKDYKGMSGPFGSYAERGANTGMSRWRFPAGVINHEQILFMAEAIRKYNLEYLHFTTGQSVQFHHLDGDTIIELFKECHEHGIYNRGAGGDHPRNIVATTLRGIDPTEPWDISPYVAAASDYVLGLIKGIRLPRKLKIAFSIGDDNQAHVTFKDIGFKGFLDGTFDVYVAGGLGPNPKMGVQVGSHVDPKKVLYYIKAMAMMFSNHGDYKNRGHARTRYLQEILGGAETLKEKFAEYLDVVQDIEKLDIDAAEYTTVITKTGTPNDNVLSARVGAQKQKGLYYVMYHPEGGDPKQADILKLLDYIGSLDEVEIRLAPDEAACIINLTAEEAEKVVALTPDGATNKFEASISCVGATVCQVGFQDSHGLLGNILQAVKDSGIDSSVLPRVHISGCPSSCGTHQIGEIGFHGFVKLVDKVPTPAFVLVSGGSENFGTEKFGEQLGIIVATAIPDFIVALGKQIIADGDTDYLAWRDSHEDTFRALVKEYDGRAK